VADQSVKPLTEHADFVEFIRAAAAESGLLPALVLKDYWVTRILRAFAGDPELQGKILFKGGTSLSKGWGLIDRFSEDIDLLLTGPSLGSMPESRGERERFLKQLRRRVEADTPLRLPEQRRLSRKEWEFFYFRNDLHCNLRYPLPGAAAAPDGSSAEWVLLEAGFRGGASPHERRMLDSMVAVFLRNRPSVASALASYDEDLSPFEMDLLRPDRTFAEKLLALHVAMSAGVEGARRVRTRHYSDIVELFANSEDVRACLLSSSIHAIVREAASVSNLHFRTDLDVERLDIGSSPALAPTTEQITVLVAQYDSPNERALSFGDRLPFGVILERLEEIRRMLSPGGA
jgi:hypothetical protein